MNLIIKQKILSWFDSYNIYDENGNVLYVVKGQLSWGHKFIVFDSNGQELGCIKEKILSFLPIYEIYKNNNKIGQIKRKFTLFKPKFYCDLGGYEIEGNVWERKYQIKKNNNIVATINKKFLSLSDTYIIETSKEESFNVLLIAIAIDADNCNDND